MDNLGKNIRAVAGGVVGVGIGFSLHAGQVIVANGTPKPPSVLSVS